jgi:hypothetical protein
MGISFIGFDALGRLHLTSSQLAGASDKAQLTMLRLAATPV